jgi:hypothetical protein
MRKLHALRLPLVVALAVAPVMADAPPDQYRPFVRTDTEIQDPHTQLKWQRAVLAPQNFQQAQVSCPNGYRLPTVKELLTLVDEEPHAEYESGKIVTKMIDRNAFPSTPAEAFWTSSRYAGDTQKAWTVHFGSGFAAPANVGDSRYVRCVRD